MNMTRKKFARLLKDDRPRAVRMLMSYKVDEWLDDDSDGPEEVKRVLTLWCLDGLDLSKDETIIGLAEGRLFE